MTENGSDSLLFEPPEAGNHSSPGRKCSPAAASGGSQHSDSTTCAGESASDQRRRDGSTGGQGGTRQTENGISLGPGNIGSRIRSLVINPKDPNVIYAGAVTGGVWKSVDRGANWIVLTDGLPTINIGALALDPADPNTIYAGSGPQQFSARVSNADNQGVHWSVTPLPHRAA